MPQPPVPSIPPGVIRLRQLRGLIIHARINSDGTPANRERRSVVPSLARMRKLHSICRWRRRPTIARRKVSREYCSPAYHAPRGLQRNDLGKPLIPLTDCPCGTPGEQIDHRIPIALAAARRDVLRAHTLDNMNWLGAPCHRLKTTTTSGASPTCAPNAPSCHPNPPSCAQDGQGKPASRTATHTRFPVTPPAGAGADIPNPTPSGRSNMKTAGNTPELSVRGCPDHVLTTVTSSRRIPILPLARRPT